MPWITAGNTSIADRRVQKRLRSSYLWRGPDQRHGPCATSARPAAASIERASGRQGDAKLDRKVIAGAAADTPRPVIANVRDAALKNKPAAATWPGPDPRFLITLERRPAMVAFCFSSRPVIPLRHTYARFHRRDEGLVSRGSPLSQWLVVRVCGGWFVSNSCSGHLLCQQHGETESVLSSLPPECLGILP